MNLRHLFTDRHNGRCNRMIEAMQSAFSYFHLCKRIHIEGIVCQTDTFYHYINKIDNVLYRYC